MCKSGSIFPYSQISTLLYYKTKKNHQHQLFNNGANKNQTINIPDFKPIWISL